MLPCYTNKASTSAPIITVPVSQIGDWIAKQTQPIQTWLQTTQFRHEAGQWRLIQNDQGRIQCVLCCVGDQFNLWDVGALPLSLPEGHYHLEKFNPDYAIAWGLGAYQFTRYKKPSRLPAVLVLPSEQQANIINIVESIYLVRDLINTPAEDMGPSELALSAKQLAAEFNADFTEIIGDDLLRANYPAIYAVGRASDDAPRLLDIRWGDKAHRQVTLVGKGVCFDTGGLDLKPSNYMLLMKKDMGGAANVLGLARMIMAAKLPICLRVLIPAVENAVSGNAYRPGDIIKSRKGLTIEIGNTDAEGRVVLADALTEAAREKPDLIIDMATLTGAARVAVGTDLPALFANHDVTVEKLLKASADVNDPMWRMPLFAPYRELINSSIADINNNSSEPYAGAITAALFLKEFVPNETPWLHFDIMAWNTRVRAGRPQGGEACALRALFDYFKNQFI